MKQKRLLFSLILAFSLLFSCLTPVFAADAGAPSDDPDGLQKDIVILFTSDVHCGVDQGFGYEGLLEAKKTFEADNHVLLVDNGDSIQGEPLGTMTTGEANIKLMNAVGYDIAIPGNHDYDYGMDRFFELVEMADFPYISCNFRKGDDLVFDPYIIKEFDGVKIGFVGVTTPTTFTTSTPKYFQDESGNFIYGFSQDETGEALYAAVQSAVDDARAEGAQYIIVMGHCGNEASCEPWTYYDIISHTNGIDCFIDGHSHDVDHVVMQNKDGQDVIRQACGTKMNGIGRVTISHEDGSVSAELYSWYNSISAPALLGIENELTEVINAEKGELDEKLSTVVAHTPYDLQIFDPEIVANDGSPIRIVRRAETNLGDLCADAFLDQSGADAAIVNGGGIRVPIEKGDITLDDILKVHPFGNMMSVIEVTGQQILDALEWGCRSVPEESGGFLQVAGITYEIHTYIDSSCTHDENSFFTGIDGEYRVKNVMIGGEPLDPDAVYKLAGTDYVLQNNGDGFTMFDGATVLLSGIKIDNQVLIDYITETLGGQIPDVYADPYGQGRIVAFDAPPAQKAAASAPEQPAAPAPEEVTPEEDLQEVITGELAADEETAEEEVTAEEEAAPEEEVTAEEDAQYADDDAAAGEVDVPAAEEQEPVDEVTDSEI